jgi:hypothetical protein
MIIDSLQLLACHNNRLHLAGLRPTAILPASVRSSPIFRRSNFFLVNRSRRLKLQDALGKAEVPPLAEYLFHQGLSDNFFLHDQAYTSVT